MAQKIILMEGAVGKELTDYEPLAGYIANGYKIVSVDGFQSQDNKPMCYVALAEDAPSVATPTFTAGSTFEDTKDVEISCSTEGATILYSTDGSTFEEYSSELTLSATTTISAMAMKDGVVSGVASKTYTKVAAQATTP